MTVEEIDIVVNVVVEKAIKEFQKLVPEIKRSMKSVTEQINKPNLKGFAVKIQQAINQGKQKLENFKKSNDNNKIAINVTTKEAEREISQLQKQINSLEEKINARQMKLNIINPQIDKIVDDTRRDVIPEGISPNNKSMDTTVNNALSSNKDFTSLNSQAQKLYTEIEMYNNQLNIAKSKMSQLGKQVSQTATTQNKLGSFFSGFKNKIDQAKSSLGSVKNIFNKIPNIAQNMTTITAKVQNNIKGMGKGLKQGLGNVLKYTSALFSLRGIYSILSSSAQGWLSNQNAGAKQLSANIEYMKYAMGSAFAPVIQYVTNLVYKLMKAIQTVIYSLFKVNIFANASSNSYANMANNAKKTAKETKTLANIDEINNIGGNDNDSSDGNGTTTPSFDLSQLNAEMSPLAEELYNFFKPLKDSWDTYGASLLAQLKTTASQVTGLISSVWGSFEKVITNGTVYTTLILILAIIGNIAQALNTAWTNAGIGDSIVQNLFNAFNNILSTINQIAQSTGFQNLLDSALNTLNSIILTINNITTAFSNAWNYNGNGDKILTTIGNILEKISKTIKDISGSQAFQTFLNGVSTAFAGILGFIEPVLEDLLAIAKPIAEIAFSTIGTVLETVGNALKAIGENEIAVTIIESLAIAIGLVTGAIALWNAVGVIATATTTAFGVAVQIATSPLTLITLAIAAVVAAGILLYKNWETVKQKASEIWENVKSIFTNLYNSIKGIFNNIKEKVITIVNNIKNGVKDKFNGMKEKVYTITNNIRNGVKDKFNSMKEKVYTVVSNLRNGVKDRFNSMKEKISTIVKKIKDAVGNKFKSVKDKSVSIFNSMKSKISNIFNGIWNVVKKIINSILGGIEKMANGIVKGMNKMINALNKLKFNVPDWVPGLGGKSFGFNIGTIGEISIPRLATGNVATSETLAIFGEYSNARTNPEITAPQSTIYETMVQALNDSNFNKGNKNSEFKTLIFKFGSYRVAFELEELRRKAQRQNGTATVTI